MKRVKGFTLIEVLTSTAIVGVLVLILTTLTVFVSSRYQEVKNRLNAEYMASRAEVILRQYFSAAINMGTAVGATVANPLAADEGQILNGIDWDQVGDTANWTHFASFWRETSTQRGAQLYGGFPMRTFMWYREPSRDTSGVIFIDGGAGGVGAAAPQFGGGQGDEFIDRVSGLRITKIAHTTFAKVAALDVMIRIRYHPNNQQSPNWCPQADINAGAGGCNAVPLGNFKDIERNFRIVLQNNLLRQRGTGTGRAVDSEERMLGNVYFFRMVVPTRWD
jgi:prepilin-type N-terminal cleavage/methylation domain-containing protein